MADRLSDEVCWAAADLVIDGWINGGRKGATQAARGVLQAHTEHVEDDIREAVDALARRAVEEA